MCRVIETDVGDRKVKIAEIKQKYLMNIIDAARECNYVDRIVLFGSSIEERCTEESDIDLAVFGNLTRGKCLTSKKYEKFLTRIYSYDDFNQAYDILYFKTGQKNNSAIMNDIACGEIIYEA